MIQSSVDWKNPGTVIVADKVLSIKDVLNTEEVTGDNIVKGITLNKATSSFVRIDEEGLSASTAEIYLDKNDNGSKDSGETIGTISVKLAPGSTGLTLGTLGEIYTTASGDKGRFVFTFTDTISDPDKVISSTTLNVDVK